MSRLCRLRNASHGDDGQWAYSEIVGLREQVEKLTEERDALRSRRCEVCGYLEHEREHTWCLREQLAALTEQNEKIKSVLPYCNTGSYGYAIQTLYMECVQLPDLASPALNRIRAEAKAEENEACAKVCEYLGREIHGEGRDDSEAFDCADAIRARRNHG